MDCIATINENIFVVSLDLTEGCVTCTKWSLALNKGANIIVGTLAQPDSKQEV